MKTRTGNTLKLIFLILLFLGAIFCATKAYNDLIYDNEYSKTIEVKAVKLDSTKVYLFTKSAYPSLSKDTLLIPIKQENYPDSLCTLYFDRAKAEWSLLLSERIRKSDTSYLGPNPFYPWCCNFDNTPFFFQAGTVIKEGTLTTPKGIRFNYTTGSIFQRIHIKLRKEADSCYLYTNVAFLGDRYPVSRKKDKFEINFCHHIDTTKSRYVFAFPFLNENLKPDRYHLTVSNDKKQIEYENMRYQQSKQLPIPTFNDDLLPNIFNTFEPRQSKQVETVSFPVNNIQFELRDDYDGKSKYLLKAILSILVVMTTFFLYLLNKLYNKYPQKRNFEKKAQASILSMQIILNCIILLGFPLLIIQTKYHPERLLCYLLFILALNLNWTWVFNYLKSFFHLFKGFFENQVRLSYLAIAACLVGTIFLIDLRVDSERLFGIPILTITKGLFILIPFVALPDNHKKIIGIQTHYLLVILVASLITCFSEDLATLIFTLFAIFLILLIEKKAINRIFSFLGKKSSILLRSTRKVSPSLLVLIIMTIGILFVIFLFSGSLYDLLESTKSLSSKRYRLVSTVFYPNDSDLLGKSESARQTIAQHIYILKAAYTNFELIPNFNQVIMPTWRTTFFSDYGVLWSFKLGGYWFLTLYFGAILLLSHYIIVLLVLINRKITIKDGSKVVFGEQLTIILNLLLALLLIQYVYSFLSNLWVLPLTGQSPGVLCPSYIEIISHAILVNFLYVFIQDKEKKSSNDKQYYTKAIKSNSFIYFIFLLSMLALVVQIYRVNSLGDEMTWKKGDKTKQEKGSKTKQAEKPIMLEPYYDKLSKEELITKAKSLDIESEKAEFNQLLRHFYGSSGESTSFTTSVTKIKKATSIDSLTKRQEKQITKGPLLIKKKLNNRNVETITDPVYSGCLPSSNTINFELQKKLNLKLKKWADTINNFSTKHRLVTGAILVAKNNGEITASASFPMLYNETKFHLKYRESKVCEKLDFPFKYVYNPSYVNAAEISHFPASIVKPLLAYTGLKMIPNDDALAQKKINKVIGESDNKLTLDILRVISNIDGGIDTLKAIQQEDFGIHNFKDLTQQNIKNKNNEILKSYAIGMQNKLIFKNIVQAYTRIKQGKKIVYSYEKEKIIANPSVIFLPDTVLTRLYKAMKLPLQRGGTAEIVGKGLEKYKIDYSNFLAKTATGQIYESKDNQTSAFILVTDSLTIGIQLFGILPPNKSNLSAKDLFIKVLDVLTEQKALISPISFVPKKKQSIQG